MNLFKIVVQCAIPLKEKLGLNFRFDLKRLRMWGKTGQKQEFFYCPKKCTNFLENVTQGNIPPKEGWDRYWRS